VAEECTNQVYVATKTLYVTTVCQNKKTDKADAKFMGADSNSEPVELKTESAIHCVTQSAIRPLVVQLEINGMQLSLEVDTGATVPLISLDTTQKFFKTVQLEETSVSLHTIWPVCRESQVCLLSDGLDQV